MDFDANTERGTGLALWGAHAVARSWQLAKDQRGVEFSLYASNLDQVVDVSSGPEQGNTTGHKERHAKSFEQPFTKYLLSLASRCHTFTSTARSLVLSLHSPSSPSFGQPPLVAFSSVSASPLTLSRCTPSDRHSLEALVLILTTRGVSDVPLNFTFLALAATLCDSTSLVLDSALSPGVKESSHPTFWFTSRQFVVTTIPLRLLQKTCHDLFRPHILRSVISVSTTNNLPSPR
jgi:hypothetical protein